MLTRSDWTPDDARRFAKQDRREPARWAISLLVALGVGAITALVVGLVLVALLAPTGSTMFAAPIAVVAGLAASVVAAALTWRGIRKRWRRKITPGW